MVLIQLDPVAPATGCAVIRYDLGGRLSDGGWDATEAEARVVYPCTGLPSDLQLVDGGLSKGLTWPLIAKSLSVRFVNAIDNNPGIAIAQGTAVWAIAPPTLYLPGDVARSYYIDGGVIATYPACGF